MLPPAMQSRRVGDITLDRIIETETADLGRVVQRGNAFAFEFERT